MRQALPQFDLTPAGYKNAHRHLFANLYPWAGEFRSVDMSKGNDMFCKPQFIESQLDRGFKTLRSDDRLTTRHHPQFVEGLAEQTIELLAVHPFRDGNGRSTRLLMYQIAERSGHELDITKLDPQAWNDASITGFRTLDAKPTINVIAPATTQSREHSPAQPKPFIKRGKDRGGRSR